MGILYFDDSPASIYERNSGYCDLPAERAALTEYIVRPRKPISRSCASPLRLTPSPTPKSTIQHRPISHLDGNEQPITQYRSINSLLSPLDIQPQSLPPPSPSHAFSSSYFSTSNSNPILAYELSADHNTTEDWTFITHTNTHEPSISGSEPETWILLDDDS